jgi:hypothetical protein
MLTPPGRSPSPPAQPRRGAKADEGLPAWAVWRACPPVYPPAVWRAARRALQDGAEPCPAAQRQRRVIHGTRHQPQFRPKKPCGCPIALCSCVGCRCAEGTGDVIAHGPLCEAGRSVAPHWEREGGGIESSRMYDVRLIDRDREITCQQETEGEGTVTACSSVHHAGVGRRHGLGKAGAGRGSCSTERSALNGRSAHFNRLQIGRNLQPRRLR